MGAVLACLGISAHSAKEHHDHKEAAKLQNSSTSANQQQSFDPSQQHDAQQGLRDKHSASVPPPQQVESEPQQHLPESTNEIVAQESAQVTKKVAVQAPLPVPGTVA
jgi:hypothetical protein